LIGKKETKPKEMKVSEANLACWDFEGCGEHPYDLVKLSTALKTLGTMAATALVFAVLLLCQSQSGHGTQVSGGVCLSPSAGLGRYLEGHPVCLSGYGQL